MSKQSTDDIIATLMRLRMHFYFWLHGQAVKTSPFHGGNPGSSPGGVTRQVKGEPVSIRRRIRFYCVFQNIEKVADAYLKAPAALLIN